MKHPHRQTTEQQTPDIPMMLPCIQKSIKAWNLIRPYGMHKSTPEVLFLNKPVHGLFYLHYFIPFQPAILKVT